MNKIIIIFLAFTFQQSLFAQKEIVGKVEFYKSNNGEDKVSMSMPDKQIEIMNSQIHQIEISQIGTIIEYETNDSGFFKFNINVTDSLILTVNKNSKILNKTFRLNSIDLKDTIQLKISDKKLGIYMDSLESPEFYSKYKEEQAQIDFRNGRKRILAGGGIFSDKTYKRRRKITKKYGIEYDYLFGCVGLLSEFRIMYRYNEVMKKLLGIENVW